MGTVSGSNGPVEPIGWAPGLDWEVYIDEKPLRAELYDKADRLTRVTARTRLGLWWAMRRAGRRYGAKRVNVLRARVVK